MESMRWIARQSVFDEMNRVIDGDDIAEPIPKVVIVCKWFANGTLRKEERTTWYQRPFLRGANNVGAFMAMTYSKVSNYKCDSSCNNLKFRSDIRLQGGNRAYNWRRPLSIHTML